MIYNDLDNAKAACIDIMDICSRMMKEKAKDLEIVSIFEEIKNKADCARKQIIKVLSTKKVIK